jgi:hypothetical protein
VGAELLAGIGGTLLLLGVLMGVYVYFTRNLD